MSKKENIQSNERELFYGEKLGKMIRCETISSSFSQDLSKFYRFHEVLEQLFLFSSGSRGVDRKRICAGM